MREQTVVLEFLQVVVNAPVLSDVGYSFFQKPFDYSYHLLDVIRGFWISESAFYSQRIQILEKRLFVKRSEFLQALSFFPSSFDGLVVNVGQVHCQFYRVSFVLQPPSQ